MSQIERGGLPVRRWPAEFGETNNPEGSVGEELRDTDEEYAGAQHERLEDLPGHERDVEPAGETGTTGGRGEESGLPVAGSDEEG